jgi:hypothetical protein
MARRSRRSRHRRRAFIRDWPARAVAARGGWLRDVGLRSARDAPGGRLRQVARRPEGHRDLASALLWRGSRLERGIRRRTGLSAWRRSCLGNAAASVDRAVDRRELSAFGRHPDPAHGRPFCRRHGAALARGGGRARRLVHRRRRDGGDGSALAELHVLLSELHPAQRIRRSPHCGCRRATRLRPHLRRLVGSQHRQRRQGGFRRLGPALPRGDFVSDSPVRLSVLSAESLYGGAITARRAH